LERAGAIDHMHFARTRRMGFSALRQKAVDFEL
jgi:hypothetical protein